jgi:hypothetical protein
MAKSQVYVDKPTAPFARLTQLEFYETRLVSGKENDCDLDLHQLLLSPTQFPALRELFIDNIALSFIDWNYITLSQDPTPFDLLLLQLSDIEFNNVPLHELTDYLPHCTSLKTLRLRNYREPESIHEVTFFDSLRGLNLEDFRYYDGSSEYWADGWRVGWEASLRIMRGIMAIVGEMKTLKKLSLVIDDINDDKEKGEKWREFKGEVRKVCQKNKVQLIRFEDDKEVERHGLTWVD